MCKILLILCLILHACNHISYASTDSSFNKSFGSQALIALEKLLNFFESDVEHLNVDGLYGLRIAQGQIKALDRSISSKSNDEYQFTDNNQYIKGLLKQIERISNRSLVELENQESVYLQRFYIVASKPFEIEYESRKLNENFIDYNSRISDFDEDESDLCFTELLGTNDHLNSSQCFITEPCWNLMTFPKSRDYRLTHQLLWFLIAKNIGCIDNRIVSLKANENLKRLEQEYCTNIYQDAQINIKTNYNHDLFLEQLLLCSIIGYEEFLRNDWFNMIVQWQHPIYGCFYAYMDNSETNTKAKRHLLVEKEMNNGCLSHKSGLASGLLATYARAFLQ